MPVDDNHDASKNQEVFISWNEGKTPYYRENDIQAYEEDGATNGCSYL